MDGAFKAYAISLPEQSELVDKIPEADPVLLYEVGTTGGNWGCEGVLSNATNNALPVAGPGVCDSRADAAAAKLSNTTNCHESGLMYSLPLAGPGVCDP